MKESKNILKNWNLPPCLQISVNRGGMLFNRNRQVFPFNLKLRVPCDVNQNKSIYRSETKCIIFKSYNNLLNSCLYCKPKQVLKRIILTCLVYGYSWYCFHLLSKQLSFIEMRCRRGQLISIDSSDSSATLQLSQNFHKKNKHKQN